MPYYGLDSTDGVTIRSSGISREAVMTTKLHDALTEALECVKAGGVIRKYSLVWSGRSEAPRIIVWKATNTSDDALRRSLLDSLAGLAGEEQFTIEKD